MGSFLAENYPAAREGSGDRSTGVGGCDFREGGIEGCMGVASQVPFRRGGCEDRHAVENINRELGDSLVQHSGDARSLNILGVCYGISLVTDVRYC